MNHRTRLWSLLTALLLAAPGAAPCWASPQTIAVPAYFYPVFPDPLWTKMGNAVPTLSLAVMNPASGPGAAPDPNYVSQIAATRAAGVKVLGYVTSSYATRDPATVKAEIDKYYLWYGVDGIFIDEADNHCTTATYYAYLNTYTKTKGGPGLTVINPGTVTPECFVTSADILLNFEGSHTQYLAWAPLGWEAGYAPSHFWHLVYDTTEADMPSTVLLSQARGAGYVYVTPDTLIPDPWDSLPAKPYWSTELSFVQPVDGACSSGMTKPKLAVDGLLTPAGDDKLKFSGSFTLAGTPVFNPVADGIRVVLADTSGVAADLVLPSGAYASGVGWRVGNHSWTWRGGNVAPAFGIRSASVKTKSDGVSTVVTFSVSGVDGSYPVNASDLPLSAALLLSPGAPNTNCALAIFPGPKPTCTATGFGRGVRCH